ncbi:MAG TPA: CDP-alcohol phosphatidyltransferase family protein [Terriglobia bacterium]|nr:CDP-alcohol phosphatidyltransferase family protein [Terriglobia bacterium]
MITRQIGKTCWYAYDAIIRVFSKIGINPNVLTFTGFAINLVAAYLFAYGYFRWAGATIILGGVFDLTDGPVARTTRRVTPFGGFFDSVLDRYSDLILLIGLLIYYGRINRFAYMTLVAAAMIGSVMTSYTRARAENLIPSCKVGFLERAERVVLIIIGALFDRMAPVLWVIVVLSNLTVVHRVIHTYQESHRPVNSPEPEGVAKDPVTDSVQGLSPTQERG